MIRESVVFKDPKQGRDTVSSASYKVHSEAGREVCLMEQEDPTPLFAYYSALSFWDSLYGEAQSSFWRILQPHSSTLPLATSFLFSFAPQFIPFYWL